jgi:hypothetical protein
MKTIIRNVADIDAHDRQSLEHVIGQSLGKNQRLEIRIVDLQVPTTAATTFVPPTANGSPTLPSWCNVYDGLSDEEIADMEKTILERADLTRPSE